MDTSYLLLYLPALHQGYIELFKKCALHVQGAYIFGQQLIDELRLPEQAKEIRALEPEVACQVVQSLKFFPTVAVLTPDQASRFSQYYLVMPGDGMSRRFADKYLRPDTEVTYYRPFLRWDPANVFSQTPITPLTQSKGEFDLKMMALAAEKSDHSSDSWRQVGAVAVKDGQVISGTWNQHLPSEHTPYINGDPRDHIKAGTHSEFCSAIHAEQAMLAEAARPVLGGADVYVTTFPCPACANFLAHVGIRRLYFRSGHASLNGQEMLESHGVEIIHVP